MYARMSRSRLAVSSLLVFAGAAMTLAAFTPAARAAMFVQDDGAKQQPSKRADIYDETAIAADDIERALARAKKENRRVLIQWGANWCGWCHLLHDLTQSDRAIARKLQYEYDVVLVDIGRGGKNLDLAEQYGADFKTHGVPYLTILDADGNVIVNQETSSLEDGPKHDPQKVLDFLTKHQAPYLSAESIFNEGIVKAAKEGKLAFVHFGAPWCGWCKRMEAWMAQDEVAEILEREFIDVKIDTDRTIGGQDLFKEMTEGRGAGIPWYAIVDGKGNVVGTSFGENLRNIGCPYTAEEIDAFGKLLRKVARTLTDDDIKALTDSLGLQAQKK